MIDWLIIPVSALAYRFRGGGLFPDIEPSLLHSLRKPIYCIVTGGVFALIAYFNTSIDALNALVSAIIVSLGSFLPPFTSPRPMFWMWQNVYRAEEVKPNILNGWMHWLAAKWGTGKPTIYGLIYGSCRGLFELPTTIALAVYYHNPVIALYGLLGGFMGVVYYVAGKLSEKHATCYAELGYGALRGVMLCLVLI